MRETESIYILVDHYCALVTSNLARKTQLLIKAYTNACSSSTSSQFLKCSNRQVRIERLDFNGVGAISASAFTVTAQMIGSLDCLHSSCLISSPAGVWGRTRGLMVFSKLAIPLGSFPFCPRAGAPTVRLFKFVG
jgi:hypothetical protein